MSLLHQFIQEAEMSADLATNVVSLREVRATRIRGLMDEWAKNTAQIGAELSEAKNLFPTVPGPGGSYSRPGWAEWLESNFGLSRSRADRFIQVANKFSADDLQGITASTEVLVLLSKDNTPEEGREEVISRLREGETLSTKKAKAIVDQHRPKPDEARKIARETGKPTHASDGNIYLGATKEQEREAEARREVVYGVRRAVEAFANMDMSAEEFLSFALPHQLWNKSEEHQLQQAYNWMTDLIAAWEQR